MAVKDLVWFKKNIGYDINVRRYLGDKDGVVLHRGYPFVSIERDDVKDFKMANQRLFKQGLIVESAEPVTDWENNNMVSDEEMVELTGSHLKLKARLPSITSVPVLYRLLENAKELDRAKRVVNMIQARIDELEEDEDFANTILKRDV